MNVKYGSWLRKIKNMLNSREINISEDVWASIWEMVLENQNCGNYKNPLTGSKCWKGKFTVNFLPNTTTPTRCHYTFSFTKPPAGDTINKFLPLNCESHMDPCISHITFCYTTECKMWRHSPHFSNHLYTTRLYGCVPTLKLKLGLNSCIKQTFKTY